MANVVTLFSPSCKFSHSNHHCIVVVCPLRKTVDLKTLGVMPWLQRKIDTLRNKMNQREHRRFIKTEEKAKVVASVWGEECIQFLTALAILPRTIMKNRLNSSFFSNHPGAIHPIIQIVQCKTASTARRRPLPFLLSLSFFYEWSTYT